MLMWKNFGVAVLYSPVVASGMKINSLNVDVMIMMGVIRYTEPV